MLVWVLHVNIRYKINFMILDLLTSRPFALKTSVAGQYFLRKNCFTSSFQKISEDRNLICSKKKIFLKFAIIESQVVIFVQWYSMQFHCHEFSIIPGMNLEWTTFVNCACIYSISINTVVLCVLEISLQTKHQSNWAV